MLMPTVVAIILRQTCRYVAAFALCRGSSLRAKNVEHARELLGAMQPLGIAAAIACVLLSSCGSAVPFAFVHGNALTQTDYDAMKRLADAVPNPPNPSRATLIRTPARMFVCDAGTAIGPKTLFRIGSFTGVSEDERYVARYIGDRLDTTLINAHLFERVTRDPGTDGATLSGAVTRTASVGLFGDYVGAQVEARLEIDGHKACAVQVNVGGSNGGFSVISNLVAMADGDRAFMASEQMEAVLEAIASGQTQGILIRERHTMFIPVSKD